MFSLTQYNSNRAALAVTIGLSLTPVAQALSTMCGSRQTEPTFPSLLSPTPSSKFSAWLLDGYVGDFLGWAGKKLAGVGSTLFPVPSFTERRTAMRANRQALKQFFSEKMFGADVDVEISEMLTNYLHHGVVLRNAGVLTEKEWITELIELKVFSKYAEDNITLELLSDCITQLTSLSQVRKTESQFFESKKEEESRDLISTLNLPLHSNSEDLYRIRQDYAKKYALPNAIDLLNLGNEGITIDELGTQGICVRSAGDVNGDGFDDVIIGSLYDSSMQEQSYVVFGSANPASTINIESSGSKHIKFTGMIGTTFYIDYSVSGAGDFNGDGYDDVIIASPFGQSFPGFGPGDSYVVFGSAFPSNTIDLGTLGNKGVSFINGSIINSVSSAGDFNGDNYDDVILTSLFAHKSYIVFGSTDPTATIDLSNLSENGMIIDGGGEPTSVSSAGDFNSDGYDDVIIGLLYPTSSYVIFGSQTPPNIIDLANLGSNGITFLGIATSPSNLPLSVSGAGDFNGDGYDDVIIGAPYAGLYGTGQSYVIFGSANPVNVDVTNLSSSGVTFTDIHNCGCLNAVFKFSVSGAGDINADGYADVMIGGAMGGVLESNSCYLVFGSAFPNNTIALENLGYNGVTFTGVVVANSFNSLALSNAGDFNGDGYNDVIIGAPGVLNPCYSYVIFNNSGSTLFQHQNPVELSQLGTGSVVEFAGSKAGDALGSVSNLGDINNDGIDDFIIGAPNALRPSLRSMKQSDVSVLRSKEEDKTGAGECYLVFGSEGFAYPWEIKIHGVKSGDQAGYSVGAAGDVNGDGIVDIIIGAPKSSPGRREHAGTSYVIFGWNGFKKSINLSKLNGKNGFRIEGIKAGDESGHSVSGAGDVNGDGYDDVIIGAPLASPHDKEEAGEAYVIFGKNRFDARVSLSHLNGANGFRLSGISSGERCGGSVSRAGNMNGDGYDDVVIGARRGLDYAGRSYVVFGKDSFGRHMSLGWLNGANGFVIRGKEKGDLSGGSVSLAGDMNGDGYDDIVIGAHHATPNIWREEAGEAYVIFGGASFSSPFALSSLDGTNGFQIDGMNKEDYLGKSVHGAGDVNDDGYADIIIGANGAKGDSKKKSGKSYVIFGQGGSFNNPFDLRSLDGTNGFEIDGARRYDGSGFAVSGVGDVDNDGFGDVLVGAWRASSHKHQKHAGEAFLVFGGTQARRIEEDRMVSMPSGKTNRYGFFISVGQNGTIAAREELAAQAGNVRP